MTRSTSGSTIGAAAIAGLLVGAILTLVITDHSIDASNTTSTTYATAAPSSDTTEPVLLVWTAGGLQAELAAAITSLPGVARSTVVKGGQADLVATSTSNGRVIDETEPGWAIPLDTLAIDPETFRHFTPPASHAGLDSLQPGRALLTEASAALRRLDVGSMIELDTGDVEVVGIIDNSSGAGAELLVHVDDASRLGIDVVRYVLIQHDDERRDDLSVTIADMARPAAARFRSPAETTWLRHGDAVTPQLFVKLAYGEFAYRDRTGRDIEIDQGWIDEHLVTEEVPLLREVRCHRAAIEPLTAALTELAEANLGHLVEPGGYAGCWSPRRIEAGHPISRHAWGIAVDLNIGTNPRGSFSTQHPRLVDVMRSAGFTWGGTWLIPDPGHYELLAPKSVSLGASRVPPQGFEP